MGEFGAKAMHLLELQNAGFNVPKLLVFSSTEDVESVLRQVISEFVNKTRFVVRSSAINEDGVEQSMAGAYHSEVGVSVDDFSAAWNAVCESMPEQEGNGIIVQQMIVGDFSGVCFADADSNRMMVNALPGLCKAVVEGMHSDYYELESGEIAFNHEQAEKKCLRFSDNSLVWETSKQCIEAKDLQKLESLAYRIAKHFGGIQDIEWTMKDGVFYVLQARPVTANPWKEQKVKIFDSANVGESYSGLVLPLTHSFANKLYAQVYRDLLRHSAVREKDLEEAKPIFDNLVESIYGRMYYRMDNWYAFLRMLPGFKRNASNLENMLMLNAKDAGRLDVKLPSARLKLIYYPLVIWKLITFKRSISRLQEEAEGVFEEAAKWTLASWTLEQVDDKIRWLFDGVLKRWYLTVENDTVMMSLFAHFSKPGQESLLNQALEFHSISTDQIAALSRLSASLYDDSDIRAAIEAQDEAKFNACLNRNIDLKRIYEDYLQRYGGRFANELKLETPGVEDSFVAFASIVTMYWNRRPSSVEAQDSDSAPWLVRVFRRFAARREVFRLYRANMFGIIRKLVLRKAELALELGWLESKEDVFYLHWDELFGEKRTDWRRIVDDQKSAYKHYETVEPPPYFNVVNGRWPQLTSSEVASTTWQGLGASSGKVQDRAAVMKTFAPVSGASIGVLVTQRTDPGWTPLMALSKALVVEHGGMLSHASIVARELKIPAVIGIPQACDRIENDCEIFVDGDSGVVSIQTANE